VASKTGFCFGVKRAVKLALKSVEEGHSVFTLGPLIHNTQVVKWLEEKGIKAIKSLDEVREGKIIIRSHGVGPEVRKEALEKGLEVIDATCPLVKRVQDKALRLAQANYQVLVVGERNHPEVTSILGYAPEAVVIEKEEDLDGLPLKKKIGVVAQTTQSPENYRRILQRLFEREFQEIKVFNTICNATVVSQKDALKTAREVDVMFILGGHHSANTRRLTELCKSIGTETHHLASIDELDEKWLENKTSVGVAAGASTPQWIVEEFIVKLEDMPLKKKRR
jgi:4-hydroxy-3-methylbut-2-enyl diphosphate reductase